jgi:26S proteasome regulatory subunit N7
MSSAAAPSTAAKDSGPPDEYISIAQIRYTAAHGKPAAAATAKEQLLALIKKREMGPLYSAVCEQLGTLPDAALAASFAAANAAELARLDEAIVRCDKDEGESEVREAYLAKSEYLVRIGENEKAHAAIEATYTKTVAIGLRLDLLLCKLRVAFFFDNLKLVKATVDRAKALLETGGDWERRNRLKVYEAVFLLSIRDLKKSSALLLDSIATFTATELLPYNTFVLYAVATSLVALPRSELRPKIIDSPEVLQVIGEIPHIAGLVNGLYGCSYRMLFASLVEVIDMLLADR